VQESGLHDVCVMDTEVCIAKKSTAEYQVVPWSLVACVLVVLVDCFLSKDREDHTQASAKSNGDTRVSEVIVSHESVVSWSSNSRSSHASLRIDPSLHLG
jgi:hypothetical protein